MSRRYKVYSCHGDVAAMQRPTHEHVDCFWYRDVSLSEDFAEDLSQAGLVAEFFAVLVGEDLVSSCVEQG